MLGGPRRGHLPQWPPQRCNIPILLTNQGSWFCLGGRSVCRPVGNCHVWRSFTQICYRLTDWLTNTTSRAPSFASIWSPCILCTLFVILDAFFHFYWNLCFNGCNSCKIKISSNIWFTLLIMLITMIFLRPLSIYCRRAYVEMMQVYVWFSSLDGLMQVLRYSDAGPRMLWCRSTDGVMQVLGWCDAGP